MEVAGKNWRRSPKDSKRHLTKVLDQGGRTDLAQRGVLMDLFTVEVIQEQ